MIGYLTVGLILGLGALFVLILHTTGREHGTVVVYVPTGIERYLRALAAAARAELVAEEATRRGHIDHAYGVFQFNDRRQRP